nr:hypothetical protein [Tanacetum cinerariifolium]
MDQQYPTVSKIPVLDTGKFEQWQFQIQQYIQHEHYALWEVIEFGDSYVVPINDPNITTTTSGDAGTKSGRTVTFTTEDMQRKKNDVKARTTLLLSLHDEHQLRFSKYKTAQELWATILKIFGGNEATKKRKKNLLKKQYGNFKAEGSESLEQTFNRLQIIVRQLQFMDVEVEQYDLNQKFLTSLAPKWLMYTIIWRNKSDLDTMSLDDLYNHLKVYELEVQKKSNPNSQNMAFISSAKHSNRNKDRNTACVSTASTIFPTASASIDEDDIEEMDIKLSMALLSMRADKFWKKTRKKISIQGSDVEGFDKSKVECFNCHKISHFSRECRVPRSQERGRKDNYSQDSKVDEQTPKALMAIDGKDLSWTGLPKCTDDTVTDYSRPSPTVESTSEDNQNRNSSASEDVASPITPKPFVKFVKPKDYEFESKTNKKETPKKPPVKYAEQYRKSNKKPSVKGNQRNWNNLKSYQLGLDFVMKKKVCFNCGDFTHLANDCRKRVKRGTSRSQNNAFKSPSHRPVGHRPYGPPVRPMISNMNAARTNRTFFKAHSYETRPFLKTTAVKSQFRAPWVLTVNRNNPLVNGKFSTGCRNFPTANRKFPTASRKFPTGRAKIHIADIGRKGKAGSSQNKIDDKGYWDSGCSRHMTGNISYLSNFEPYDGGRLGHLNFKTMNKLVRHNLVRGLPTKCFENDHTFTACLKGNQHKANLTDDFSRFTWTFFLKSKNETSGILKKFITEIENLKDLKVKIIRTPQQNGVAERRNRTLIEAARTMLADAKLPVTFWAEAVNTSPTIGFLKPFSCHVMILNTLDNLGKFEEKGDEGYFIGYSMSSKAFRVFNKRTRRVEKNLHVEFLENKAIEKGSGPNWLFDIDSLTKSMNYVPMDAGTISTNLSGTKDAARQEVKKDVSSLRYISLPNWAHDALLEFSSSQSQDHYSTEVPEGSGNSYPAASTTNPPADQMETLTVETSIPTVKTPSLDNILSLKNRFEDILRDTTNSDESNGEEADINNMETAITASPTPTLRIHKDHAKSQIIVEPKNIFDALQDPSWVEAMYGLHQAPRAWYDVRSSNTPMDKENPWGKEGTGKDVDLHLYRSMIGSFMYLTASRPDIMFVVCACARHQVTPKECHLHAVKRIFRYLKGHLKLGLWYPKDSPFELVSFSDSDYGGTTQDRKSTTGGCQFLGRRLSMSLEAFLREFLNIYTSFASHIVIGWLIGTSKFWGVLRILMISLRLIPLYLKKGQNKDSFTSEDVASPNPPKPFVKFVKPKDIQPESKSKEQETPKKSQVKYAEQYRHSNKKPKVKGNQRNWNNLKSYQLGPKFVLNKKACYNYGDFSHLANDCRRRVQRETTRSQNHTYKRPPPRSFGHKPHGGSMRPSYRPAGHKPHGPAMNPKRPTMNGARPYK